MIVLVSYNIAEDNALSKMVALMHKKFTHI